jgi:anion-transporting  ArsA/GET3 family ATPase
MKRYLAVPLYVLMVFASGVLVGAVGHRLYSAKSVNAVDPVAPKPKPTPEEWRRHMVDEMQKRLKLTEDQVAKLQTAFDNTRQSFNEYDQRAKAQRKAIIEEQHNEIRTFLNPDQKAEYEKFLAERQKRRADARAKKQ